MVKYTTVIILIPYLYLIIILISGVEANGFLVHEQIIIPKWSDLICEYLLTVKEIVVWPIVLVLKITVPSCNSHDKVFWVPITMFMCIFWIGCGSFVVVELITIIGKRIFIILTLYNLIFITLTYYVSVIYGDDAGPS